MTRSVSSATEAKLDQIGSEPGYFVEIQFPSGTVRFSSRETTSWNALSWVASTVKVAGIEGTGQRASIDNFDADAALRTLILSDGINDIPVKIWKFYVGALAAGDPVLIFQGVGDGARISKGKKVSIGLARTGSRTLMSPRLRIGPALGFNHLPPEGTVLRWLNRTLRLERPRA